MYTGIILFWLRINFCIFINALYFIRRVYNAFSSIAHFMKSVPCWAISCFNKYRTRYCWGLIICQTLGSRALRNLSHLIPTLTLWVRNDPPYIYKETETDLHYIVPSCHRAVSEFSPTSTWKQSLCSLPAV